LETDLRSCENPILFERKLKSEKKMKEPNRTKPTINTLVLIGIAILSAIIVIAMGILLYLVFYAPTAEERAKYSFILTVSGIFAAPVFWLLFIYGFIYARILKILAGDHWVRWEYPKEWNKGDVYFCKDEVYDTDSTFGLLGVFGLKLLKVEIPSDNSSVIRFTNLQYYSGKTLRTYEKKQEIKIPPGKEEEAQKIVQHFLQYFGQRSIFAKYQWHSAFLLLGTMLTWAFVCFAFIASPAGEEMKKEREQRAKEYAEAQLQENINQITPLLNKIRQIIEPKFDQLKTLQSGKLTAKEAGFDENSEVLAVLYGHCPTRNEFYVSVVLKKVAVKKSTYSWTDTGIFNYTTTKPFPVKQSDSFCRPPIQKEVFSKIFLSAGWLYGETDRSPYIPTPSPTANSKTNK